MTDSERPGYLGADLLRGAIAAAELRPDLQDRLAQLCRELAERSDVQTDDPAVVELLELIEQSGLPVPPLLPRRPAGPSTAVT